MCYFFKIACLKGIYLGLLFVSLGHQTSKLTIAYIVHGHQNHICQLLWDTFQILADTLFVWKERFVWTTGEANQNVSPAINVAHSHKPSPAWVVNLKTYASTYDLKTAVFAEGEPIQIAHENASMGGGIYICSRLSVRAYVRAACKSCVLFVRKSSNTYDRA